jgi:dTDP-4-dehydrorhamnose 3,5-epimerase
MTPTIDGVLVKPLVWHNDQRGSLAELVRVDDPDLIGDFAGFGQVYVTTLYPGVVKGWHQHARQWDRMVCLRGRVMLGLVDAREDSPTHGAELRVMLGDRNFSVVLVPAGVWHGLKNIGTEEAMVCNVVSQPYDQADPDEIRIPPHGVLEFDWSRIDS